MECAGPFLGQKLSIFVDNFTKIRFFHIRMESWQPIYIFICVYQIFNIQPCTYVWILDNFHVLEPCLHWSTAVISMSTSIYQECRDQKTQRLMLTLKQGSKGQISKNFKIKILDIPLSSKRLKKCRKRNILILPCKRFIFLNPDILCHRGLGFRMHTQERELEK